MKPTTALFKKQHIENGFVIDDDKTYIEFNNIHLCIGLFKRILRTFDLNVKCTHKDNCPCSRCTIEDLLFTTTKNKIHFTFRGISESIDCFCKNGLKGNIGVSFILDLNHIEQETNKVGALRGYTYKGNLSISHIHVANDLWKLG